MTQSKGSTGKSSFWHWVRVVVSFLTFCMIFPNASTEDMDKAMHDADKDAVVRKL